MRPKSRFTQFIGYEVSECILFWVVSLILAGGLQRGRREEVSDVVWLERFVKKETNDYYPGCVGPCDEWSPGESQVLLRNVFGRRWRVDRQKLGGSRKQSCQLPVRKRLQSRWIKYREMRCCGGQIESSRASGVKHHHPHPSCCSQ
ncbi:hypothetical protein ILYODFUR_035520 [Ilyodon furcidens]|uniref:Uncharacterized protein n=1 Tax=Ilyodon furcidens TaxID=33524 RepID=A0ABV0UCC7_9TELE